MRKIKAQRRDHPVIGLEFASWLLASFWNSSVGPWSFLAPNHSWLCLASHRVVQCLPGLVSSHLSPTNGGRYSRSYGQGIGQYVPHGDPGCEELEQRPLGTATRGPLIFHPKPSHSWIPTLVSFLTPGLLYYLVNLSTDQITTLSRHPPWLPDTYE